LTTLTYYDVKLQYTPPTPTRLASAVWTHPSAVVTQFTLFPVLLSYWGWWQVTTYIMS